MAPKSSKPLSPEWKIVSSRRYPDKVYYFNVVTGVSSWEVPNSSTETTNNKECVKRSDTHSDGQLQNKCTSLERSEAQQSRVSENKPAQLCRKHQQEKQPQNIPKKESAPKRSNGSIKPPTAVVAPVVVKKTDEYNSEPLDAALLKRKLQVLYQEQESQNVKKKRVREKQKKAQNVEANYAPQAKCVRTPKHNLCEKHLNALKMEAQKATLHPNLASSSRLSCPNSASSQNVSTCLRHQNESYQAEVEERVLEDVEILDVSESLTKIDDLPSSANGSSESLASYYIVVDTNVLIYELKFIDEIKDTPIEGCGPPHIFIPWIVIQELDGLKKATKNTSTWRAAAEAVRYLNSVLKAKHPRFHGQSPQEVADWAKTYSKCNDDRILECCLSLATKMPREKVILLTNDKNLSNKALVCDIQVHTWDSMLKVLKPDVVFRGDMLDKKSSNRRKSNGKLTTETQKSRNSCNHTEEISDKMKSDIYKQEIHSLMSTARQHLKDVLQPLLEAEMQAAYGDVWCEFKLETKLLKGILEAIKKYWKAVFSFHFSEKDRRKFELLYQKSNQPEGFYGNKEECLMILSDIEDIFLQINRHWPHINPCVEKIQNIRASCVAAFGNYKGVENSVLVVEAQSVFSLFEHNWSVLNQLCGIIMDYCDIPHDFQYEKSAQFPPQTAFRELMCNLYPGVHELKQLMSKIVEAVTDNRPCTDVFKKFFKALTEFVPSLGVKVDIPEFPNISWRALEKFCTVPQNREMIENGLKQLLVFHEKLDKAVTVIMSTKKRNDCQHDEERMMCD